MGASGGGSSCQSFKWSSNPWRSVIWTIQPSSSMARYQANCPWVMAQAIWGDFHPGSGLPSLTYRAIWVATHKPTRPRRISTRLTVLLPRSGLSLSPCSRRRISATGWVRSRFHSRAFMLRSRWASKTSIRFSFGFDKRRDSGRRGASGHARMGVPFCLSGAALGAVKQQPGLEPDRRNVPRSQATLAFRRGAKYDGDREPSGHFLL